MIDKIIERTYEEFHKERCIIINGEIDDTLIEGACLQIFKWNEQDDALDEDLKDYVRSPIRIFISSRGGYVTSSLALISSIITSRTPVYTYALGLVASAAFMIFIVGHKRYIQPYTSLMYHDLIGGSIGKTEERKEKIVETESLLAMYQDIVKKHTKITQKMLDKIHKEKLDQYYYAPDALRLKIADAIF